MKVGIDAHALGSKLGGNETYIRNVIGGLAEIDPNGDYTLFVTGHGVVDLPERAETMPMVRVRPHTPLIRIPLAFPIALLKRHIDVVHVQYFAPPICPSRIVVSVHDLAFEHYPEHFRPGEVTRFRRLLGRSIDQARVVLTLSEFSKRDIVERYGVATERIVVAGCAPDPMFRVIDGESLGGIRERFATGDRFILCVGTIQPRKNLKRLIEAYIAYRKMSRGSEKLVLVGRKAWMADDLFATARRSEFAADLIFTDYVSLPDLALLYNAASVFVYPSLFEGFGLPPIEAMACGTPVITSNTSSLPEVVGDAALLVDPLDVEALTQAIYRILSDGALAANLSVKGRVRASQFSWATSARLIRDVYQRAME